MLPAVTVLGAMSALLLLIACANIAGLALVRAVSRRGEIGLRLAVGATRVRIVRLLLIENLVLAVPAALLGLVAVSYGVPILFATVSQAAPGRLFLNVTVDRLVVGFSVLAACISAVAVGIVPALRATRLDLIAVVNEDISPRGAAKGRLRSALVVSQVAVSMLLLVAAGLVAKSLGAARTADVGFDPDNVFSVRIDLRPNGYDEARGRVFLRASSRQPRHRSGRRIGDPRRQPAAHAGGHRHTGSGDRRLCAPSGRGARLPVESGGTRLLPDAQDY